ncbi:MAG: TonB-dependent receptor [Novosphingobium sp.]|nr:TonB-dependent receptor [Novosphingobium sp.]
MNTSTINKLLMASTMLTALFPLTGAHAQEATGQVSQSGASEDVIIVTARRRDESVQDIPLVVNTVSSEDIQNLNLQDAKEVQSLVPGLQLRTEANGIGGSGQLRGVQYDINSGADPTVAFYLNDAPIGAAIILSQMYDVGQVEVQRGPQGTLRGIASPSGSITFTTIKPNLSEAGGSLSASLNDIGTYNGKAALNIPIIENVLGIRLSGVVDENNSNRVTSIDSDATLLKPFSETQSGRIVATFKPTDWLKLEGMYQVLNREASFYEQYASFELRDSTAPASPLLITPKDRLSILESPRFVNQKFDIYNWRGEVRFGGQALIYQGSHTVLDVNSNSNQDQANFLDGRDVFQINSTLGKSTSHEIRLQNEDRVFGIFDYVVGFFNKTEGTEIGLIQETPVLFPSFIPSPPFPSFLAGLAGRIATVAETPIDRVQDGSNKETSFFGNVTAHIGDATQVSGGLRFINLKRPDSFLQIGTNLVPNGSAVDENEVIYTASVQHFFTPELMVYGSTGTSFRLGPNIFNSTPSRSPLLNSFISLASEKSESYEIGLKSTWLDGRLTFNLTGYHQKFDNYPFKLTSPIFFIDTSFAGGTPVPAIGNNAQFGAAVPVKVNGVEAELAWKVTPEFNVGIIASYADGKIKNGVIPCNDLNGDGVPDVVTVAPTVAELQAAYGSDFIGACSVNQRASFQPPFSATAQAEYALPVSGTVDAFARGLFTYFGSSKGEPTNAFDDVDSYGLLNLFAGLRGSEGNWEVNFFAKNVFDVVKATSFNPPATTSYQELTLASGLMGTQGRSFTSPYSVITTTPPRELGINLRIAFGSR